MRFTKMHGAGNDYVYIDCFRHPVPADPANLSRIISDRHFGIGADGLILICPPSNGGGPGGEESKSRRQHLDGPEQKTGSSTLPHQARPPLAPLKKADARMRMFNADGSESEHCGNGIRCVAKYLYDHDLFRKPTIVVESGNGVYSLDVEIVDEKVQRVRVDMGEPILQAAEIPTTLPGSPPLDVSLEVAGITLKVTCISMGNPHCITFVDEITDEHVLGLGPRVENHPAFPRRTNAEFVRINNPEDITLRVWERGSGETLACGTGACATAVACVLNGKTGRRITAHLPGGDLLLEWSETDNRVYMTGPAVEVFEGEFPIADC